MRRLLFSTLCSVLTCVFILSATAPCQSDNTVEGIVVSSSSDTLVVRADSGQHQLLVFDRNTNRPRNLSAGSRVRVASTPTDEAGVRLATTITLLETASTTQSGPVGDQAPPPAEIHDLERDIKREVRHYRLGVRVGAALDPELFMFGVHSQFGPIFHPDISFRPNAEFAFGEVTDLIALNLEAVYRLPISSRRGRWSAYVGGGPALNFIHQNFERQSRNIDFGNFDYETGLNFLTGLQFRRGTFFEVKTSLWSHPAPTMRLIFGYTF